MQRPSGITLTAALMALLTLLGIIAAFTAIMPPVPENTPMSASAMTTMIHVVSILWFVVSALFVFLYWKGYNWMRWVVMVYSVIELLFLFSLHRAIERGHLSVIHLVGNAVLAAYLLYYLNTASVKAWFDSPRSPSPTAI